MSKPRFGYELNAQQEVRLEFLVLQAQVGDRELRERLLQDYSPFMAKTTSKICKKYIDTQRDDEFCVALNAFNEAIDQYSIARGSSFLSFAEMVIHRRVVDFIRKEQRFQKQLPLSTFEVEDEEEHWVNPVEVQESLRQFEIQQEQQDRKQEVSTYSEHLQEFGISLQDLVEVSPKHRDSQAMLMNVARRLADDRDLVEKFLQKKTLPIKELAGVVTVSRKTLERHRKYIIAISLIYLFDYPYLRSYLRETP